MSSHSTSSFRKYTVAMNVATTWLAVCMVFFLAFSLPAFAAGGVIVPGDSNSGMTVENAIVRGKETTIFFLTFPQRGDPDYGKACTFNYYTATLRAGLPSTAATSVGQGVCAGYFQKSRLLDDGTAVIITGDHVEWWKSGKKTRSRAFSSMDAVSKLGVSTGMTGAQLYAIGPDGGFVVMVQVGDRGYDREEYGDMPNVVVSVNPDGSRRWEKRLGNLMSNTTPNQLWAANDGGALLHLTVAGSPGSQGEQLRFISARGTETTLTIVRMPKTPSVEEMTTMSQQELQEYLGQQQKSSRPERLKKLGATPREGGGFDVLYTRERGEEGREGTFLMSIGPDGSVLSEVSLGSVLEDHGLERWSHLYLEGGELLLLGQVLATQQGVNSKRKTWMQTAVSRIDARSGQVDARLMPLDRRYLEAAMNAGDAGMQYLQNLPGGKPALLTRLGGKPLAVSIGMLSKHPVVRVNEFDDQLVAYTEVSDNKRAQRATAEVSRQRNAEREARMQRMEAGRAKAAGMTVEEFNALSKDEQREALIRSGNYAQLMDMASQEAQRATAQERARGGGASPAQAGSPQGMNAQMAAMMAQAQAQMANNPNVTPEMRARMDAMIRMGQAPPGQTAMAPAEAAAAPAASKAAGTTSQHVLKLDSGKKTFIEYENAGGGPVTLLISDRRSGKELLRREYEDGVIYEYVNFGRFDLPLEQIRVVYRESSGKVLEDLTPMVAD